MQKLDPVVNQTCRIITRCMKLTNIESLYILAGIAPPIIRRLIAAQRERYTQLADGRHMFYGYLKCRKRFKRRNFFDVHPLESCGKTARVKAWTDHINSLYNAIEIKMGIEPSESIPAGHKLQWTHWKSLNRLRTGYGRAAAMMHNWGTVTTQDAHVVNCKQCSVFLNVHN